jgi:hypothetical protein
VFRWVQIGRKTSASNLHDTMNRSSLLALLVTALAFLGGLGGVLGSKQVIAQTDVAAVNDFGKSLIAPLAGILLAVVGGVLAKVLHVHFLLPSSSDDGKKDDTTPPGGGLPLVLFLGTMAVLMTGLPSCSTFEPGSPVTTSFFYRDASGAKSGLTFTSVPKIHATK